MQSEGARIVRKLANRRADQRRPAARYAPPSPNQADPRPAADQPWPNGSSTLLGSSPSAPFRLRTTAIAPGGRWTPHDRLLRLSLYRQELAQRPNQAKPMPPSEPQGQNWSTSNLTVSLLVHGSPSGPQLRRWCRRIDRGREVHVVRVRLPSLIARLMARTKQNRGHHRNRKVKSGRQVTCQYPVWSMGRPVASFCVCRQCGPRNACCGFRVDG